MNFMTQIRSNANDHMLTILTYMYCVQVICQHYTAYRPFNIVQQLNVEKITDYTRLFVGHCF